jgi:hypothetical protein
MESFRSGFVQMMPVGFAHHGLHQDIPQFVVTAIRMGLTLTSPRDRIGKTFSGNERNESE